MPFDIGSPFSPQYLGLIQQERARRDRSAESGRNDAFRHAQLRASVGTGNAERALRAQMANAQFQMQNARTDAEREAANRQFQEMQRQFDEVQTTQAKTREQGAGERTRSFEEATRQFDVGTEESARRFDIGATETARHSRALEDTAGMREENRELYYQIQADKIALDREKQFGTGTAEEPSEGSIAAGRTARASSHRAGAELSNKRAELIADRIAGKLPEQLDDESRTKLAWATYHLAVDAQEAKSAKDAAALAARLLSIVKNEYSGGFDMPGRELMSQLATAVQALLEDASLMQAFSKAYQEGAGKEVGGHNQEAREARRAGRSAASESTTRGRGSLQGAASAIEEARRRARDSVGRPSSTTGR